jgi:hypothetical protein
MDALQYGCFEIDKGLDLTIGGERRIGAVPPSIRNDSEFDEFSGR